jgi:carotenoid cleavage dioxygenase
MTVTTNPYLEGNFAPVLEEVTATGLPVTGHVPGPSVAATCATAPIPPRRPNPLPTTGSPGTGWCTGSDCVTGGPSGTATAGCARPRLASLLGEEPHPGPVHADMDFAPNTNVIGRAGRTFAIVEAGMRPYELTNELDTIGPCDFGGTLDGGYTAHPEGDPHTGELYAVSSFFGWGKTLR